MSLKMSLHEQVNNLQTNWKDILLKYPNWKNLEEDYNNEKNKKTNLKIFPKCENIFKCFSYFNIEETRIILVGQDPYHGENQATGLAFGVSENMKKPPSLQNIFKKIPYSQSSQTLEDWAKQGILLLNSSLTVRETQPNSHSYFWKDFTLWILSFFSKNYNAMCILWGANAHLLAMRSNLIEQNECFISSHPSPLSAYKKYKNFPSFLSSDVFEDINMVFRKKNKKTICW